VQTQPIQIFLEALGAGQGFDLDEISKFHVCDSMGFAIQAIKKFRTRESCSGVTDAGTLLGHFKG
jgi:hypothetical protein